MPTILLINIDSTIPNLALKKIEVYHQLRGDNVIWDMPIAVGQANKIYVSCLYDWNRDKCVEWLERGAMVGGSGYSLDVVLPEEIDRIKPRMNLGFTTRGCVRKCAFCIVPEKEGAITVVGDLMDLWDGMAKQITVLDNNIFGLPEHFKLVCEQAQKNGLRLDFNQGLDHRLLTDDLAAVMKKTRHKGEWRFAFDHPDMIDTVRDALKILRSHGIKRGFWYVLVGFDTDREEDLFRLNFLKAEGQTAFVQRYNKDGDTLQLSRWANQPHIFKSMTYWQFLERQTGGDG